MRRFRWKTDDLRENARRKRRPQLPRERLIELPANDTRAGKALAGKYSSFELKITAEHKH